MEKVSILMFLSAFAIQRLIELVDEPLNKLVSVTLNEKDNMSVTSFTSRKKTLSTLLSVMLGAAVAFSADMGLLQTFELVSKTSFADKIFSGLVMGSGTEAVNSVLKYVRYAKDERGAMARRTSAASDSLTVDPDSFRRL